MIKYNVYKSAELIKSVVAANTVTIIISSDNDDGEQFAAWLQQQGHTASVGNSTGNYINGALTSSDAEANETMGMLWNSYCNA